MLTVPTLAVPSVGDPRVLNSMVSYEDGILSWCGTEKEKTENVKPTPGPRANFLRLAVGASPFLVCGNREAGGQSATFVCGNPCSRPCADRFVGFESATSHT